MNKRTKVVLLAAFVFCLLPSALHAARLHTSGFETNNLIATEWNSIPTQNGTLAVDATTPRSGTYNLDVAQGGTGGRNLLERAVTATVKTSGTLFGCFGFRIVTAPATFPHTIFAWRNVAGSAAGGGPVEVRLTTGPKIQIYNTLTATATDGTTTLSTATWYVVCEKVTISDTVGVIELRLNNGVEATQTNVDTLDGANGLTRVGLGGQLQALANWEYRFDDVKVNDETGTFETGYPTWNAKIALLKPASDQTVTWTKTGANCSATTNTDCVDDEPGLPDDASGYNASAVALNEDRLNSTTLPAEVPSDADMISLTVYDRWDGNGNTGTRTGRHLIWDEASAQTNGPTHARCDVVAGTWSIATSAQHSVFDLGTRTKANVEAFDLGYEPINAAECRITSIWGNVEWVEAPLVTGSQRRQIVF